MRSSLSRSSLLRSSFSRSSFYVSLYIRRLVKEQVVRFRKEISAIYPASVGIIFCDRESFVTG